MRLHEPTRFLFKRAAFRETALFIAANTGEVVHQNIHDETNSGQPQQHPCLTVFWSQ